MVDIFIWHNSIIRHDSKISRLESIQFHTKSIPPENKGAWPRIDTKEHDLYKSQASSAIGQNNSYTSFFGKSTGSNRRNVPINRTLFSKWNQGVFGITLPKSLYLARLLLNIALKFALFKHFRTWQCGRFFRHTYVRCAIFLFFTRIICRLHCP